MSILIHVPEKGKSVVFPGVLDSDFSSDKNPIFAKMNASYLELAMVLAYQELLNNEEFTHKDIEQHLTEFYPGIYMESTLDKSREIEKRLQELFNSKEFLDKYDIFYPVIQRNVITLFASGAVSHDDNEIEVINTPSEFKHAFSTTA